MMNVILTKMAGQIAALGKKNCLVADKALEAVAKELAALLKAPLLIVPQGESCKTRAQKEAIEDFLFTEGFGRDSCLIAIGGGSVGDLVGFTASTYCRGIAFVNIPTTLLAMVDACLGGKTAINTAYGKNMLGSHWPATLTLIETEFLKTLSPLDIASGAMEMVKHGLIADKSYFESLVEGPVTSPLLIQKSLMIKDAICKKDPLEQKERLLLNFGHTVGHALETYFNYKISHGMAVGIGMKTESALSYLQGWLSEEEFRHICAVIDKIGAFKLPERPVSEYLIGLMRRDKKALQGVIRTSALEAIGKPKDFEGAFCTPVSESHLKEALKLTL